MKAFLAPLLVCLMSAGAGYLLRKRSPRLSRVLLGGGVAALILLCLPLVAALLLCGLQSFDALTPESYDERCGAIVVLAGDANEAGPEFGGATVGPLTLERLRYAAHLARATHLPLLMSGGPSRKGTAPLAQLMKEALESDFGVNVRWIEARSGTTRENVAESTALLRNDGVERCYVVTHAWHMPRAIAEFERANFAAVAAPTGFRAPPTCEIATLVPSAKALRESTWALHEWIGRVWYALSG